MNYFLFSFVLQTLCGFSTLDESNLDKKFLDNVMASSNWVENAMLNRSHFSDLQWPPILMPWNESDELAQALHRVSVASLNQIDQKSKSVEEDDFVDNLKFMELLVSLREKISTHKTYINLLMADVINRFLIYHFIKELEKELEIDDRRLTRLLSKIQKYNPPIRCAGYLLTNSNPALDINLDSVENAPLSVLYDELWQQIQPNILKILPEAKKSFHHSDLIHDTDFAVLLWRIITTDHLIFDVLPRILLVRQQNSQYFLSVTYPKILEFVGRYTRTFSVGAQILGFRYVLKSVFRTISSSTKNSQRFRYSILLN